MRLHSMNNKSLKCITGLTKFPCPDPKRTSIETSLMAVSLIIITLVLMAEIVSHYFPKYVELHNYITSSSATQKLSNWNTLNQKVFKRFNAQVSKHDIDHIITASPDTIERVLYAIRLKINQHLTKKKEDKNTNSNPDNQNFNSQILKSISGNKQIKNSIAEKQQTIKQLKETVEILELKVQKMDQLLKVKDKKIENLILKLQQAGIS